jgi:hypothetical protein
MWCDVPTLQPSLIFLCVRERDEDEDFQVYIATDIPTSNMCPYTRPDKLKLGREPEEQDMDMQSPANPKAKPQDNKTRHDTTRHDTTRHDTTRHDTTRHTVEDK